MPAKSKSQLRMIYARRKMYGSRKNAPEKWKWVFDKEWGELKEGAPEKIEESVFENYLDILEAYKDEDDWSPMMRKALKSGSEEGGKRLDKKEKEKEQLERAKRREEEKISRERARKISAKAREEREDKRSEKRMYKPYDDQDKLSAWLKRNFEKALVDVVEQLMNDGMEKDEAIEASNDFDVKDMVRMDDPKKFQRLQELKRQIDWDWVGWLYDVMGDYVDKHVK